MKRLYLQFAYTLLALLTTNTMGTVYYVDVNSANPTLPYTNWATAASSIQDAVDTASAGDMILVTNGVYQTGGRVVYGAMTNRVVVGKAVTVQSVNGPAVTVIKGYQVPGTTNGDGAVRCVYLTNGVVLAGFTLTGGATRKSGDFVHEERGGGVWCESTNAVLSNCVLVANAAFDGGGGAAKGTLIDCTILSNTAVAYIGGGAFASRLYHCMISGNYAGEDGGGLYGDPSFRGFREPSFANNCTLMNNSSGYDGGGTFGATLITCTISNNLALDRLYPGESYGGGAESAYLTNCVVTGNWALTGGGAESCNIYNSLIFNNHATLDGGGLSLCFGYNCTITSNSAARSGGGMDSPEMKNSIVYYNDAPLGANYYNYYGRPCGSCTQIEFCCTTPFPTNMGPLGVGNLTNAPVFVDQAGGNFRLQSNSPCINTGSNAYIPGSTDLDGRPRVVGGTIDIGAYEFQGLGTGEFIGWLQQYGLATDGSMDSTDSDGDGFSNLQEYLAGTDPTNSASSLCITSIAPQGNDLLVTWTMGAGKTNALQASGGAIGGVYGTNGFSDIFTVTNTVGIITNYLDVGAATNAPSWYYRVRLVP